MSKHGEGGTNYVWCVLRGSHLKHFNLGNCCEEWKRKRVSSRCSHDLSRYCHSDVTFTIKGASRRKCSTLSKVLSSARYPLLWLNPFLYLLLLSHHLSVLFSIFFFFIPSLSWSRLRLFNTTHPVPSLLFSAVVILRASFQDVSPGPFPQHPSPVCSPHPRKPNGGIH
jgi:hypothetical protein